MGPLRQVINWKFVFPKSTTEILVSSVMVLGDGAFERWLGHKGKAFMNGIRTHKKDHSSPPVLLPCEDAESSRQSAAQKRALPELNRAGTPISDSNLWNCEK